MKQAAPRNSRNAKDGRTMLVITEGAIEGDPINMEHSMAPNAANVANSDELASLRAKLEATETRVQAKEHMLQDQYNYYSATLENLEIQISKLECRNRELEAAHATCRKRPPDSKMRLSH